MANIVEQHYVEAKAAGRLYVEAETDLLKLKAAKTATRFSGMILSYVVVLFLGAVCAVILLAALGFALGDYLNSFGLGFLCAGLAGVLLTVIVAFVLRKIIEKPIIQSILREVSDV